MAIGGYEQNPEFWPDVDPGFAFGLFELEPLPQVVHPVAATVRASMPTNILVPDS